MFGKIKCMFTKEKKVSNLDELINSAEEALLLLEETDSKYQVVVDNLKRLYELKAQSRKQRISPDTVAIIAANLLGIILILGYEKANIVTSKAVGFILRGRV